MSESPTTDDDSDTLQQVADAFGQTLDPLGEFEEQFTGLELDPFDPFREDVRQRRTCTTTRYGTTGAYSRTGGSTSPAKAGTQPARTTTMCSSSSSTNAHRSPRVGRTTTRVR
jgi:hypothetical protein